MTDMNPYGSAFIDVAAPATATWEMVTDVSRHPEWSAECVAAEWTSEGGRQAAEVGATFTGHNAVGEYTWDAPCTVTEVEPARSFAYSVGAADNPSATWRWEFEALAGGDTRVTHSFDAPDLLRPNYPFPGRDEMLRAGLEQTLARFKEVAEDSPG